VLQLEVAVLFSTEIKKFKKDFRPIGAEVYSQEYWDVLQSLI